MPHTTPHARRRPVRRYAHAAAALAALAVIQPASPPFASAAVSTTLNGRVFLPDGQHHAPAATVDLMLADPTGAAMPGTAFARGVAGMDGRFTIDPPERDDLVAMARAGGGYLPVAVQVGKLAPHGSINPDAGAGRLPDVALFGGVTLLHLAESSGSPAEFSLPILNGTSLSRYLEMLGLPSDFSSPFITDAAEIVLQLADSAEQQAQVAAMFSDPDLVAGNENLDDPDLIPPLWAIVSELAPTTDTPATPEDGASPEDVGGLGGIGVPIGNGTDPLEPWLRPHDGDDRPNCGKDPGTQWWDSKHRANTQNYEGTKTYIHLDTYSCRQDTDPDRDEVIYKWAGYTAPATKKWTIWRLKFRTSVDTKHNYRMKYPDPLGNHTVSTGTTLTWTVGFDKVATGSITGRYQFAQKKIHGWQYDGEGKLYHVSWISNKRDGSYTTDGFNDGGGFNLDIPEGSNGRDGVLNSVWIWRCYWKNGYDNSEPTPGTDITPKCDETLKPDQ